GPNGGTLEVLMDTQIGGGSIAAISGPGDFTRTGPGSLSLSTPAMHSGQTFLLGGGTITTNLNSTASFSGRGTVTVSGVLSINGPMGNHIADSAPVVLRGGILGFVGSGSNEQIGTTILAGGNNVISLNISGTRSLFTAGVQRDDRATLNIRGQ